jgi:hypothetical protein
MIHPFQADLSTLKDSEVELKLQELTKKYYQAQRLGNRDLLTQVLTFVTIYREELARRLRNNGTNASKGLDKDLDQLINVE